MDEPINTPTNESTDDTLPIVIAQEALSRFIKEIPQINVVRTFLEKEEKEKEEEEALTEALALDQFIERIFSLKEVMTAYYQVEDNKPHLERHTHLPFLVRDLKKYSQEKQNIEFIINTAKREIFNYIPHVQQGLKEEKLVYQYEQIASNVKRIIRCYGILTREKPDETSKLLQHLYDDFTKRADDERREEKHAVQRVRIREKLDARWDNLQKRLENSYQTVKNIPSRLLYEQTNAETQWRTIFVRARKAGVTLPYEAEAEKYLHKKREELTSRKKQKQESGVEIIPFSVLTGRSKESSWNGSEAMRNNPSMRQIIPQVNLSVILKEKAAEKAIYEPAADSFSWITYSIKQIKGVPRKYQSLHYTFLHTTEKSLLTLLSELPERREKLGEEDVVYRQGVRNIFNTSYQQGYLKRIAETGLGRNKEIINNAIKELDRR